MSNYVLEIKTRYCDSEWSNHIGYSSETMDKMGGFQKVIGDLLCTEHFAGNKDFALVVTKEYECVGDNCADIVAIFEYDTREEAEADIPVIQRIFLRHAERFILDELHYNVDLVTFETTPDEINSFIEQCIQDQF